MRKALHAWPAPRIHHRVAGALLFLFLGACSGPGSQTSADEPGQSATTTTVERELIDEQAEAPGRNKADASADEIRVAAIEKAINETRGARHECWAFAAADDFRLEGTIVLRLVFGSGDTAGATVLVDEPSDERLTTCILELYQAYRWPGVFEAGQSIELPLSFRAPDAQYTVAQRYVEPVVVGQGKMAASVLLTEKSTGNGAGALSVLMLKDGMDVALHRHSSAEILYVQSGQGTVYGLSGRKKGTRVGAGHGIYIPAGTAHALVHEGKEPLTLVQLYAPAGPERRWQGGHTLGTTPVGADELERPPRNAPAPLVNKKPGTYAIAGGSASVAIYFEEATTGDRTAYMGVFTARPGVRVPPHRHAAESEILLVTRGKGTMTVAGEDYPIEAGTAVQVPANTEHAFEVTSQEPVVAIQFYTPSGPEQRFKKTP